MTLHVGDIAFYWRTTAAPGVPPNPVPDFLPFDFAHRPDVDLIVQVPREDTLAHLERVYEEPSNVGYLQEGHALAPHYGDDFLAFVTEVRDRHLPSAQRISEVGAGGCYLLRRLRDVGFEVAAIDPSPIAADAGAAAGVEVIPAFYPAPGLPPSDLLLHYDVLEHTVDPVAFLADHARDLRPGGLVVFAVPDCTQYIAAGDVSMILHEHLNYFDAGSLGAVVRAAGFEPVELRPGGYGSVLYCAARPAAAAPPPKPSGEKWDAFEAAVTRVGARVDAFIAEGTAPGHRLGCYVPLRAVPYLSRAGVRSGVRFFDDDAGLHGRYFDGFPVPVEGFDDLVREPVTHLLVLSTAFGERIRQRVLEALPGVDITIRCLGDLVGEAG